MNRVEEGVANFREFQGDARDFFSRADERAMNDEKHRNKRDQEIKDELAAANRKHDRRMNVINIVLVLLGLLLGYLTYRDSQRKLSYDPPKAGVQSPQDAGNRWSTSQ